LWINIKLIEVLSNEVLSSINQGGNNESTNQVMHCSIGIMATKKSTGKTTPKLPTHWRNQLKEVQKNWIIYQTMLADSICTRLRKWRLHSDTALVKKSNKI
jgi:hypothetical protein